MASSQNSTSPSQPRFPALVTLGDTGAVPGTKESKLRAGSWACSIRQRINAQLKETGKVKHQDMDLLVAELINVFVTVLQKNNRNSWLYLLEVFHFLQAYQEHLHGKEELMPYLEKIYSQYQSNLALLSDLDIPGAMAKAFSKDFTMLHSSAHPTFQKYWGSPPPQLKSMMEGVHVNPSPAFSGQPYPFVLERAKEKPEDVFKPAPVMLQDLHKGVAVVGTELAQFEALWKSSLGFTLLALGTEMPIDFLSIDSKLPQVSEGDRSLEDNKIDLQLSSSEKYGKFEHSTVESMTGRSAAELCVKYRYKQRIIFLYLNIAQNRHYRPYDLVTVPKLVLGPEHYIFSPFGIVHVHPEEGADVMTLADWHREAVLWELLQDIPFFKHFLIRKVFFRWLRKVRHIKMLKKVNNLRDHLLAAIPHFGTILQHISRLLQELRCIHWFPQSHSHCFTFSELQQALTSQNEQARLLLKKFFNFCTAILKLVQDDSYKMVEVLKRQVQNPRPFEIKDPIYLQRILQNSVEKKFHEAQSCLQRLGNLAQLINHMICQNLVTVMQEEITAFVYKVIQSVDSEREAFLKVSLVFDSSRQLIIVPSGQHVQDYLCSTLDSVLHSVVQLVQPDNGKESDETTEDQEQSELKDVPRSSSIVDETGLLEDSLGYLDNTSQCSLSREILEDHLSDILPIPKLTLAHRLDLRKSVSVAFMGHRIRSEYSPVSQKKLRRYLQSDLSIQQASATLKRLLTDALREIQQFCTEHDWLAKIYDFVYSWTPRHLQALCGCTAIQYREQILQLQAWAERVKSMKRVFITQSNILSVDCNNIREEIVPLLVSITGDIFSVLTAESIQRSKLLISELSNATKVFQTINTEISTFSHCTRKVEKYKQHIPELQERVNYICSLNEVIRKNCRPLHVEEETLEHKRGRLMHLGSGNPRKTYTLNDENLTRTTAERDLGVLIRDDMKATNMLETWNVFLSEVKKVSAFISSNQPVLSMELIDSINTLLQELEETVRTATTGKFLDPSQNAQSILDDLQKLQKKLESIAKKIKYLNQTRCLLTGTSLDLAFIPHRQEQINLRQKAWQLFQVILEEIEAWKLQTLSKFNNVHALEKLTEWKKTLSLLKNSLPAEDEVLQACAQLMEDFAQYLPVLEVLGSPALKEKHWRAIFSAMNVVFHEDQQLTISDLLGYPLHKHFDVITRIYNKAKASLTSLQTLQRLQNMWEQLEFQLTKFLLRVWHQDSAVDRLRRPTSQIREPEGGYFSQDTGTFILSDTESLKMLVEDSILTLQILQSSPHAADQQQEVKSWAELLHSFGIILDLWITFQQKWVFLTKILHEMKISLPRPETVSKFETVDLTYRAFMQTIYQNASVLSILPNQLRVQMNKDFHGETLKAMLINGITVMEEIVQDLQYLLENIRASCPRLYFLSNDEVLAILVASDDLTKRVPWVKRCFQNIQDMEFETLEETADSSKLVTKAFIGHCGEKIVLHSLLHSDLQATIWLSNFEFMMKNTLFLLLQDCVAERLFLQKKLDNEFQNRQESTLLSREPSSVCLGAELWAQLAVAFPFQCILVAEQVSWYIDLEDSLFNKKVNKLYLKQKYGLKLEFLVEYIQKHRYLWPVIPTSRSLLLPLFSALVTLTVHHQDIVQKLMKQNVDSKTSFEWAKLLKYNVGVSSQKAKEYLKKFTPNTLLDVWLQKRNPEEGCSVEVLGNTLHYDYEYIGPSEIPVGNTMTEKSILGLIFAVEQYHCGTVIGPHGAGKTETLLTLGNALGRLVVCLNSSKQLSLSCISQYLYGAMHLGAWLVINHAERMDQEKLSVLGQDLMDIHKSYMAMQQSSRSIHNFALVPASNEQTENLSTIYEVPRSSIDRPPILIQYYKPRILGNIFFHGNTIPIAQNYSCFMTLSELVSSTQIPANLRILMRPVSLIQPNLQKISEVSLLAAGFQEVKHLTGKLCSFLQLTKDLGCKPNPDSLCFLRNIIKTTLNIHQSSREHDTELPVSLPYISEKKTNETGYVKSEAATSEKEERSSWSPTTYHHHSKPQSITKCVAQEIAMIRALSSSFLFADVDSSELYHRKKLLRNIFPMSVTLLPELGLYTRPPSAAVTYSKTYSFSRLASAISLELQESKLYVDSDLAAIILQLSQALFHTRGVMIVGPPGSGKTTSWKILARAINRLATNEKYCSMFVKETKEHGNEAFSSSKESYGPVSCVCLYPNSLCVEEFLGEMKNGSWKDGLFPKILRSVSVAHVQQDPSRAKFDILGNHISHPGSTEKWVVLDGTTSSEWLDSISCLFNTHPFLTLPNGEQMKPPDSMRFIFEETDLANISPAMATRCRLVYCSGNQMWRSEFGSLMTFISTKYNVTQDSVAMLKGLSEEIFPPTFNFLEHSCRSVLEPQRDLTSVVCGMQEVSAFRKIFQALMAQHLSYGSTQKISLTGNNLSGKTWSFDGSPNIDPKQHQNRLTKSIFLFAYIWGFGSHLNPRYWPQFDVFVRGILSQSQSYIQLPCFGTIFDLCPSPEDGSFVVFKRSYFKKKISTNFFILPQYESLIHVMDCLLESGSPVLLAGEAGAGKSSFAQMIMHPNRSFKRIAISGTLSTTHFHQLLQIKVPGRKGPSGQPLVQRKSYVLEKSYFFIFDDVHAAAYNERSRSYPILEMIRQNLSGHDVHTADSLLLGHEAQSTISKSFATTEAPSGSRPLSARFTRLFTIFALPTATKESLVSIYAPKIKAWLRKIPVFPRTNELSTALTVATIDLYYAVREMFRPSPNHWHYLFSLHDIDKVLKGLFILPLRTALQCFYSVRDSKSTKAKPKLGMMNTDILIKRLIIRLWLHESLRTFYDRLITEKEKAQLIDIMTEVAQLAFCTEKFVPQVTPEDSRKKQKIFQLFRSSDNASSPTTEQGSDEYRKRKDSKTEPSLSEISDIDHITEPLEPGLGGKVTPESKMELKFITTTQSIEPTLVGSVSRLTSFEEENIAKTEITEDVDIVTMDSEVTSSLAIPEMQQIIKPSLSAHPVDGKTNQNEVDNRIRNVEITAVSQPSSLTPFLESKALDTKSFSQRSRVSWKKGITETYQTSQKDSEKAEPTSPFLLPEHLLSPEELLQDLIFSKDMLPIPNVPPTSSLYLEQKPEVLRQQLSCLLQEEGLGEIQHSGLVLYHEAIHHLAHLTRVLSMSMGHSVLIAMQLSTGRRSLVTLAAQLTESLLLEVRDYGLESEVDELVRKASRHAGILGKSAVLLVDQRVSVRTVEKLCSLMAEGTSPALYSPSETKAIVQDYMEANRNIRKTTKPEVVLERFHEQVKMKVHVVFLLAYGVRSSDEEFSATTIFSMLKLACNIDIYCSWGKKTLLEIASHRLSDVDAKEVMQGQGTSSTEQYQRQLSSIIQVMAQIHQSAASYAEFLCPCLPLITPKNYLDFIDLFLMFNTHIKKTFQSNFSRLTTTLNKIKEVTEEVERFKRKAEAQLQELIETLKFKQPFQKQLETREVYLTHLVDHCSSQQNIISDLEEQLEQTHARTQNYLNQTTMEFLNEAGTLQIQDIEELRSYRVPPPLVIMVTDTLCMMFGRNPGWENAKLLIAQENFFQVLKDTNQCWKDNELFDSAESKCKCHAKDLVFYNKSQITDEMYEALSEITAKTFFNPATIQTASSAAASLCRWILAVFRYSSKLRKMQKELLEEQEYENQMRAAQSQLGEKLLRAQQQKLILQEWTRCLQEAKEQERKMEDEHRETLKKQKEAQNLEEMLASHASAWKVALEVWKRRERTFLGDALLLAAAASYLGAFPKERSEELLEKWKRFCKGQIESLHPNDVQRKLEKTGILPVSSAAPLFPDPILYWENFSILELLSTHSEQSNWSKRGLPCNSSARGAALLLQASIRHCFRRWPLLVDPDHQGESWLRVVQKNIEKMKNNKGNLLAPDMESLRDQSTSDPKQDSDQKNPDIGFLVIPASDPELDTKLQEAAREGECVLVTTIERRPSSPVLSMLIQRELCFQKKRTAQPFHIHPLFRLCLSTSLSLGSIANVLEPSFFKSLHVIDMSINRCGMEELLLKEIVTSEMPPKLNKNWNQLEQSYLELQVELKEMENLLMESVMQTSRLLSEEQDFLPKIRYYRDKIASLQANLQDLESMQLQQKEPLEEFRKVSRLGADLYIALQHISRLHPLYRFSKDTILKVTRGILESKKKKDASKPEIWKARMIDISNSLIGQVLAHVQLFMPERHSKVFSFLTAIAQLRVTGQVTDLEWLIFLQGLKDSKVKQVLLPMSISKPSWISVDAWKECSLLEILPVFGSLRSTLVKQACQWQEYFKLSSTVIGPVPCASHSHLSLFQKAILWRVFRPDKLYQVACDLTTCVLGGSFAEICWLDMNTIFSLSRYNVPLVYLIPGTGSVGLSTHPLYYIEQMAKEKKKEGSMIVISFGTPGPKTKVLDSLMTCQRKGHWLVLNNCHLLDHWPDSVINQLMKLVDSNQEDFSTNGTEHSTPLAKTKELHSAFVHPDFRLWFITAVDAVKSVPGYLLPQAQTLLWETPQELRLILERSCSQAMAQVTSKTPVERIIALAVLHGVLLHRQHYGNIAQMELYHWTQADLFFALNVQEKVWGFCQDPEEVVPFLAGSVIYGGHILDPADAVSVLSVAQGCLKIHSRLLPTQGLEKLASVLTSRSLSGFQEQYLEIQERIQKLPIPADPITFGLCSGVEENLICSKSQVMFADLLTTQDIWQPRLTPEFQHEKLMGLVSECVNLLEDMQTEVKRKEKFKVHPHRSSREEGSRASWDTYGEEGSKASSQGTNKDTGLDALQSFLLQEWKYLCQMISKLHTDLCCTQDELLRGPCPCSRCEDITWALRNCSLPKQWTMYRSASSQLSVPKWLKLLRCRLEHLSGYLESDSRNYCQYNPSVFQNPKGLLVAVIEEKARAEHQDLDQYRIQAQIMQRGLLSMPVPQHGLYLSGLQLHNALWDTRFALIQETLSTKPCSLPVVWITAEPVTQKARRSSSAYAQYLCPLYVCTDKEGLRLQTPSPLISLLLTSKLDPVVCSQRRVHARSVL
uniref:Dynein heavy chain domain-containing protein 1 n=1 Tax=Geotrypetes seraphini TaxID=260995 RepID=A0A6P8RJZ2_GEOSA|nr:dynein heavy chain domain-containing protein 1 [Geotrypetes seraphini]